jgi:histone acetyltransferase (RNA polymerase elongator complex component)
VAAEVKTTYSTAVTTSNGLMVRSLTDKSGNVVCTAQFIHDRQGNAVVVELETPVPHQGLGYARHLLSEIGKRETRGQLRVISNESARPFYKKLSFTEVAPNIYCAPQPNNND